MPRSGIVWSCQKEVARLLCIERNTTHGISGTRFSPRRAREEMHAERRSRRVSKVTPSQLSRRTDPATHNKKWRDQFTTDGYGGYGSPA